jgi:hypothetical protein
MEPAVSNAKADDCGQIRFARRHPASGDPDDCTLHKFASVFDLRFDPMFHFRFAGFWFGLRAKSCL